MNHNNRKQGNHWFLTFPQLGENRPIDAELSLELFLDFMQERLPGNPVKRAILSHEDHAARQGEFDDMEEHGVHIHVTFELTKKWKCPSAMDFWDDLYGKHPNIQTCRKFNNCVVYVGKDGDYATHNIDYDEFCEAVRNRKGTRHNEIARHLMGGMTIKELLDHEPGYVLNNYNKICQFLRFLDSMKTVELKELEYCTAVAPYDPGRYCPNTQLANWIQDTFVTGQNRDKHLYLYGETGIGKSTFVNQLRSFVKVFGMPYDAEWMDMWDNSYQVCVFEEFNPHYTLTFLNSFLDPFPKELRRRNSPPMTKPAWMPCIFLSNIAPEEVYPKASKTANGEFTPIFRAFARRLKVINFNDTDLRVNLVEKVVIQEEPMQDEEEDSFLEISEE